MPQLHNERVAYFNGEFVPESRVLIPLHDRGFRFGDAAFDTTRTFGHRIFKIDEHLKRFYRSLRYLRINPGLSLPEMKRITEEVLAQNLHLVSENEDTWISQRVTRGQEVIGGELSEATGPTVIVECTPLPLKARAHLFRDGIRVVVPAVQRTSPESLNPRAKTHNYLNLVVGDLEAKGIDSGAWAVLPDGEGRLTEGVGCNLFVVIDGKLVTPRSRYVLPGVSRETVIELARQEGIPVEEGDIDLFDAHNADEVFLTSTSLCLCGVRSINGTPVGEGRIPGPITKRLTDAYVRLVEFDFVDQYLRNLED